MAQGHLGVPDDYQPDWPDDWSDRRRAESVVVSANQPRSPPWVAERAEVNVVTARAVMEELAESIPAYVRDEQGFRWEEDRLQEQESGRFQTRSDTWLRTELARIEDEIERMRDEYDVESPEALEAESDSAAEVIDAREWRHAEHLRETIRKTLR